MNDHDRKLLIVEDDASLREEYSQCFDSYGVSTAADRDHAIAELRRHEPAVVLLDLDLPPKSENMEGGLEALADVLKLAPHTNAYGSPGRADKRDSLDVEWQYPNVSWFKLSTVVEANRSNIDPRKSNSAFQSEP